MDYEVERLVFVVRSVADGVDKGFKAAEKAASGLEEAYRKAERTEKQLEKALANLRKELDLAQKSGQQNTSIIEKKIAKLEDAKKQLEETTAAQKKQYEEEAKGQASMLASIAIIGAVRMAWNALSEALTESTDAYVKNRNAQIGLRSIAEGTGQSMGMVSNAVQDLISDGRVLYTKIAIRWSGASGRYS
jgi:chromosome segregation ATPase